MNKILNISLILGVIAPLNVIAIDSLDTILVQEHDNTKVEYNENKFYKSYSSELITKDDIEEESVSNVKDAIKKISNVKIKDRGSFEKSISIRGLSGERVVSIVDGTKMSNHGISMGGGGELALIESSSVEKIELIKGSPSIIYDPGATGGIVKVTTFKNTNELKNKVKLKHTYLNNSGYKLIKNSTEFEVKYNQFYINANIATTNSDGISVKNKEKLQKVIDETNNRDERGGTKYELKNLGYESDSKNLLVNYNINDKTNIFYKTYDTKNKNISSIYGVFEPKIFYKDKYNIKGDTFGIRALDFYNFSKVDFLNSNMNTYKLTVGNNKVENVVELDSNTKKLSMEYPLEEILLLGGIERTYDKARTYTYSEQTYNALYLSSEYIKDKWSFSLGARSNHYKVTQTLMEGQNPDTAKMLVGVSGIIDKPIKNNKVNYSSGIIYNLNDETNIAFNYSRTYRYPSLYERFAFGGGLVGGGSDMKPEEADNFELSWKYLDDSFSYNVALFQSNFDTYNTLRNHKRLKDEYIGDPDEMDKCWDDDNCNPFETQYIFTSFDDVTSRGFEIDIEKRFKKQNIDTSFNISKTTKTNSTYQTSNMANPLIIKFRQEPLEFGFNIKKKFKYNYKPWVKLKLRHVTNSPKVNQVDGFDAFTVGDLYFGAKYQNNISFNGGIKNISNTVYHEAYSPLDGVERSFFFNISIALEKL